MSLLEICWIVQLFIHRGFTVKSHRNIEVYHISEWYCVVCGSYIILIFMDELLLELELWWISNDYSITMWDRTVLKQFIPHNQYIDCWNRQRLCNLFFCMRIPNEHVFMSCFICPGSVLSRFILKFWSSFNRLMDIYFKW